MFYVSISTFAIEKIRKHAKENPDSEVIGLLTGRMQDNVLIVEEAVTGEIISEKTRASLTPKTMAKIADQILSGKTKGNVVGWYHSHPGFGVFMSEIDVQTQMKLHQFSPYIVALVFDPIKDEMGLFTMNMQTSSPVTISEDFIHIFNPNEEPIPQKFRQPVLQTPYEVYPISYAESRKKHEEEKGKPPRKPKFIYTAITTIAIACLLFTIVYMVFLVKPQAFEVIISPESVTTFVAFPQQINASINGGIPEYNCTWYVNGTKSSSDKINKTQTSYTFSREEAGTYIVYANVTDDVGNTKTSKNVTITVLPLPVVIDIISPRERKIQWGEIPINGSLKALCYDEKTNDYYLRPLSHEQLEIKYSQPKATSNPYNILTNEEGFFSYVINDATYCQFTGNLNIDITYKGNQKYHGLSCELQIELDKRYTNLTINVNKITSGVLVEGELRDIKAENGISNMAILLQYFNSTKNEWELIRDVSASKTDATGSYSFNWNPKPGNYTIRALFTGTDLYEMAASENKTVSPKINVKIQNDTSLNVNQGENINFTITLTNTGLLKDTINLTFQFARAPAQEWNDVIIQDKIDVEALKSKDVQFTWDTANLDAGLYFIGVKATYSFGGDETCYSQVSANITATTQGF